MLNKTLLYISISSLILLNACTTYKVHKIDVQQGNIIEQEKVNELKPGMRKDQVQFILGTPILKDIFHSTRWDYIYTYKPGYGPMQKKRLSLYFDEDALVNIVGDFQPQETTIVKQKIEEVIVVPLEEYQAENTSKWYQGWFDKLKWWEKDKTAKTKPIPDEPAPNQGNPNINFPQSEKNIK